MFTKVLLAFLIGGVICLIGQILIDLTSLTPARILVATVSFGVLLGARKKQHDGIAGGDGIYGEPHARIVRQERRPPHW